MRLKFIILFIVLLASFSLNFAQPIPLPTVGNPAHYLVLEATTAGEVRVIHHQSVTLRTPFSSLSDTDMSRALNQQSRLEDAISLQLVDTSGAVVYQSIVHAAQWLRSESLIDETNPDVMVNGTNIDGHMFPLETRTFVVRVPDLTSARTLRLQPAFARSINVSLNLDSLTREFAGRAVSARNSAPIDGWSNGDPANRADILLMGDGYTSAEQTTFETDTLTLANGFGSITPYKEYANYVNIAQLFTPSAQSGADRPTCSDPDSGALDDNTFVDTAFDATFCSFNTWRALTVNNGKVFTAAASAPDWDQIVVVVNTPIYGGTGGSISTLSTNELAVDILLHEHGHSFTDLADEYSDAYPGFPLCSDIDGSTFNDCEANVTNETNRANIRWKYWIDPTTEIPTSGELADVQAAGLWEGARYFSTGMYRQGNNCMMRALARPFCYVASEAYAIKIYEGGWGAPVGGIRNIEPGTLSPVPGTIDLPAGESQTFNGQLLSPIIGPNASVIWTVNGSTVQNDSLATGATASFNFAPTVGGTYTVELRVIDNSPIIHPTKREGLTTVYSWTVNAESNLVVNSGFETEITPWQVKNASGDKIKCNKNTDGDPEPEKFFSRTGDCAFGFKGIAGENAKLVQTIDLTGLTLTTGDTLDLSMFVNAKSTAVGKVKVRVKYSDPLIPTGKITEDIVGTDAYSEIIGSTLIASETVSKIKVQIDHKSPVGKVYVDDVTLSLGTAPALLGLPH